MQQSIIRRLGFFNLTLVFKGRFSCCMFPMPDLLGSTSCQCASWTEPKCALPRRRFGFPKIGILTNPSIFTIIIIITD